MLFCLYFTKGKRLVTGVFLYIYTTWEGRKAENRKCVCQCVVSVDDSLIEWIYSI